VVSSAGTAACLASVECEKTTILEVVSRAELIEEQTGFELPDREMMALVNI
jgi:hypothetical protein